MATQGPFQVVVIGAGESRLLFLLFDLRTARLTFAINRHDGTFDRSGS